MANKVPVGQTIGGAYRFAFAGIVPVLGVVWLPMLLVAAAGYFLFRDVALPPFDTSTPEQAAQSIVMYEYALLGPFRIVELVLWVCAVVIEVGLTRLALGIGGKPFVFFTLGWPFWRMLGANLIFAVIMAIVIVPFVLAIIVIAVATGAIAHSANMDRSWIDPAVAPWAIGALTLFCFAAVIGIYYVYLRLWFFIAPVVVAENHIDIRHAWRLGKGNVLRILVVVIAITFPMLVLIGFAEGFAAYLMIWNRPFGTLPDAQFFTAHSAEFAVIGGVILIGWILLLALVQGARAIAYRAVVPQESATTV